MQIHQIRIFIYSFFGDYGLSDFQELNFLLNKTNILG